MYEPIHGSAPDIAGMDKANPIATILSVAMMLRYTFGLSDEAASVEKAVYDALEVSGAPISTRRVRPSSALPPWAAQSQQGLDDEKK